MMWSTESVNYRNIIVVVISLVELLSVIWTILPFKKILKLADDKSARRVEKMDDSTHLPS